MEKTEVNLNGATTRVDVILRNKSSGQAISREFRIDKLETDSDAEKTVKMDDER